MACIVCGGQFNNDFNSILDRKKKIYETTGQGYIVFKKDDKWQVTRIEYFKHQKGIEYFHISEFKGS